MIIHNSVTENRESSRLHGVIWILTESLLQRGQAEILPELVTTEAQMGMPCHLRSHTSTHCRNPRSKLFIHIFKCSPKMNFLLK